MPGDAHIGHDTVDHEDTMLREGARQKDRRHTIPLTDHPEGQKAGQWLPGAAGGRGLEGLHFCDCTPNHWPACSRQGDFMVCGLHANTSAWGAGVVAQQ